MNNLDVIVRVAVLILSIVNLVLTELGVNPIPFAGEELIFFSTSLSIEHEVDSQRAYSLHLRVHPTPGDGILPCSICSSEEQDASSPSKQSQSKQHVSPRDPLPLCPRHRFWFLLHLSRTWVGEVGLEEGMCWSEGWKPLS